MQYAVAGTKFEHTNPRPRLGVAACCLPPAACRSGISLMEVLISIGIVAIGLVSIASLIPVGGLQAQKADQIQRQSDVGLDVLREFTTRGFAIVDPAEKCQWVRFDGSKYVSYFPLNVSANPAPDEPFFLPVAIDPMMVAKAANSGTAADKTTVSTFPANAPSSAPTMKRLATVSAASQSGSALPYTFQPKVELADSIFRSTDDVVVDQPTDASLPGTSSYFRNSSNNPLKRSSAGIYSWLATLTPYYREEGAIPPIAGMQCTLSLAILYRRNLAQVPSSGSGQEEMVSVTKMAGGGITGGDMTFTVTQPQFDMLRPGQWLMLCRNETWKDSATPPVTHTLRNFKWYRILSAAAGDTSGTAEVTLSGPDCSDWATSLSSSPVYACLFDSVVAVYQKVISLEGSSEWSQ
jgi:Tfp pilus assembly protein PilV